MSELVRTTHLPPPARYAPSPCPSRLRRSLSETPDPLFLHGQHVRDERHCKQFYSFSSSVSFITHAPLFLHGQHALNYPFRGGGLPQHALNYPPPVGGSCLNTHSTTTAAAPPVTAPHFVPLPISAKAPLEPRLFVPLNYPFTRPQNYPSMRHSSTPLYALDPPRRRRRGLSAAPAATSGSPRSPPRPRRPPTTRCRPRPRSCGCCRRAAAKRKRLNTTQRPEAAAPVAELRRVRG